MSTAAAPAPDATNVASEALNRTKGFLGTAEEMTVLAPQNIVAWLKSLSNAELLPRGERALHDIADDILVLDEIRQRFHKTRNILGYKGWRDFVEKNSRYSIRTIQRHLAAKNGKDDSKSNITTGNMYTRPKRRSSGETRLERLCNHEDHAVPRINLQGKTYHTPKGDLYVHEYYTVANYDGSYIWLVENLKTGAAEYWRTCDLTRIERKGEVKNRCETYAWTDSAGQGSVEARATRKRQAQERLDKIKSGATPENLEPLPLDLPTVTPRVIKAVLEIGNLVEVRIGDERTVHRVARKNDVAVLVRVQ
jgi:hypothetical protein